MVIDSSAVVAILAGEQEADSFAISIDEAEVTRMSAATYVECAIVIDANRNTLMSRRFEEFVRNNILLEPFTPQQARIAREAYRDFGKGSGHPARLNFGDCFAYALAKDKGEPLLFKGTDFGQTDVQVWKPED